MSNVYITKALRKEIPSDAILLTRGEVIGRHWDTIRGWKSQRDTWPFKWGIGILAGISSVTSLTIINHYRRVLKLQNYGKVTLVLPAAVIPSIAATIAHVTVITQSVLLVEDCPLCIQTRAAALQVGLGVLFPVATSPIIACLYASSYGTYNVPPLRKQYIPEISQFWVFLIRKLKHRLPIAIAVNAFAATALTYFEIDSFYRIQRKIYEKEDQFRRSFTDGLSVYDE